MIRFKNICLLVAACIASGCAAPVRYGDKAYELNLKRLASVDGKVSVYICREEGWSAKKIRSTVFVDGNAIGMLLPKMFAHTTLNPGAHSIYLRNENLVPPTTNSGELEIDGKGGDVVILWVGVTGHGWGALTVDNFETKAAAIKCVSDASYGVIAD